MAMILNGIRGEAIGNNLHMLSVFCVVKLTR